MRDRLLRRWLPAEARALLAGEYPPFVYGRAGSTGEARRAARIGRGGRDGLDGPDGRNGLDGGEGPKGPARGHLPVFAWHTLDAVEFDAQLAHLQENGYTTLTLDDALGWLSGEEDVPERSVVLTIDDGRLTTWTVAWPLLRARGMVATAFVIPGYLEEGPRRPTLASAGDARAGDPAVHPPEEVDRRTSLRWSEVESMHASGVVAIESHTMLHRRVEVSGRLRGFLSPESMAHPRYTVPLPPGRRRGWEDEELEGRLGLPIFESLPLLAAHEARPAPEDVRRACVERVAKKGGRAYFERAGWRRELRRVAEEARPAEDIAPRPLEAEQRWELVRSREALEARLSSKRVRHLALPEGAGSAATADFVRACGYQSCIWALLPSDACNRPGTSPYQIGRLKHDYLFCLPGRRRRGLPRVLLRKSLRRARGRTGY